MTWGQQKLERRERHQEYVEEVKARHPHRSSACGALLSELFTAKELADRRKAADHLGLHPCRRGVKQIERLIDDLEKRVAFPEDIWGGIDPDRDLLGDLFVVLGRFDTDEAQGVLARIVRTSRNPLVRADAMEAMAYGKNFDLEPVLPYISMDASEPEILSALYAAEFGDFATKRPAEATRRIKPLLAHSYPGVRAFAARALAWNRPVNRHLIESLSDDESDLVRREVADMLRMMDEPEI
jgi:HEAT repeat protein